MEKPLEKSTEKSIRLNAEDIESAEKSILSIQSHKKAIDVLTQSENPDQKQIVALRKEIADAGINLADILGPKLSLE